ncbi:hypothetical protein ACFL6U_28135 [Planctomycetota bacterium]
MAEWEIHRPLGECSATGQTIEYGSDYIGALVETGQGLERRDYCLDYWEQESPPVFCFWRSKLPNPEQKRKIFVSDEMLMAFFERLENETEAERVNFRFVLTLILMRKRRLKYDSTVMEDGKEVWRLKVTGEKRLVDVVNPHLGEEQIEALSGQLGEVLNADL